MATLLEKNLAKTAIGTGVVLVCIDGDGQFEKIEGTVTDNDFSDNIEITLANGEVKVINYGLIKKITTVQSLKNTLISLKPGTAVLYSCVTDTDHTPSTAATVLENDGEDGLNLRLESGEEELISYSLIASIRVVEAKQAPAPKPKKLQLYEQKIEGVLNASDRDLQNMYDSMPGKEKNLLSAPFNSFKYGIITNDRSKMTNAAEMARQILFREDETYCWSSQAALFCGYLLRRVSIYDSEVFMLGDCYWEAALVCHREQNHTHYGAYALLALTEVSPDDEDLEDLLIMAATAVTRTDDTSGLKLLYHNHASGMDSHVRRLIDAALTYKGIQLLSDQSDADAMNMLGTLYPNTDMAAEMLYWNRDLRSDVKQTTPPPPEYLSGVIKKLNWVNHTGVITGNDGQEYSFRYQDISNAGLFKTISECLSGDMDNRVFHIKFKTIKLSAYDIQPDVSLVDKARMIQGNNARPDRYQAAYDLCKRALNSSDASRAITDLIAHTISIFKADPTNTALLKESLRLYEKYANIYPSTTYALMNIAQCYCYDKQYQTMLGLARRANAAPNLEVRPKIGLLTHYLRMVREYYDSTMDKALLKDILDVIHQLEVKYRRDFLNDPVADENYKFHMLHHRIFAECELDMLEDAEADLLKVPDNNMKKSALIEMVRQTRARLFPEPEPAPTDEDAEPESNTSPTSSTSSEVTDDPDTPVPIPVSTESDTDSPLSQSATDPDLSDTDTDPYSAAEIELDSTETYPVDISPDEISEMDIPPYEDQDGWKALHQTPNSVIDYAMTVTGPARIGIILAYLKAGASLNPQIYPVYRAVALAVNDPMEAPDYSITALEDALANNDTNYPALNDCCMGAAFLRASFLSDRGYDYSSRGLRDSLSITQNIPALDTVYDVLEEFRKQVGRGIDIYADYRNHGTRKLMEDFSQNISHANELYIKFILTEPREGVKFARLLATKGEVFAKDGYLATMLRYVIDRNNTALENERDHFVETYLNGIPNFASKHISATAVDAIINECWEQAGKNMQMKKRNATLQGDRRNNLRSNITSILNVLCRHYALAERSAGLQWRTTEGSECYRNLRDQLLADLQNVVDECSLAMDQEIPADYRTGLFLLAHTAKEMIGRLDGTWSYDQSRFMYVDFLRTEHIMLNEEFLPELESTFCALPNFNVLARIRKHVEATKLSFRDQIAQIYGLEKTCNNYGTAARIMEYLAATGNSESVSPPDNYEQFEAHSRMQLDIRFRGFIEHYSMARTQGQIMPSDPFCYHLEDTVRYWYAHCSKTKNYGFLTIFLMEAEAQIHAVARHYENTLNRQLDELIIKNAQRFADRPDAEPEIRKHIKDQNFIVAEDLMHRIRNGEFPELMTPEALAYLDHFWNSYVVNYNRVADNERPLSALLGRRTSRDGDTEKAQQLIDHWIFRHNSTSENITALLNLLGWKNIQVNPYHLSSNAAAELYEVRTQRDQSEIKAPTHPIAAFGSKLESQRMYVSCLYDTFDSERLYEKMRSLDALTGSKIILLDYALGSADRRALARKLKRREFVLRNVCIVIDRVLLCHLANIYNESTINRILMATAMPFTYCQPYVVDSAQTMPPEIFIGRKDELQRIEQSDGVNLIYGGRQLGKSALLKKALLDLDGKQQQRAVLIDINKLDCAGSARLVSSELITMGITPDAEVTEDWDMLCQTIQRALRSQSDEIRYFLLMLDEADTFIDDCANYGYRPLVALKNIQQSMPGQFKYVLAGLHNIVKFNRQVALGNNSVIPHMSSLKITPFSFSEAQELLTLPMSYLGFSIPNSATISQIAATCNYFPGLMQLFAKMLIESMRDSDYAGYDIKKTPPYIIGDNHLRKVTADKQLLSEIYSKFDITLRLDEDQGSCYYPLALLISWLYNMEPSTGGYCASDILHHANDLSIGPLMELNEEKIEALLQELQDLNILRSVSDGFYLLASKNFRDLLGSDDEIYKKLLSVVVVK